MLGISKISLMLLGTFAVVGIIGSAPMAESTNPKEVELVGSRVTHMGRSPSEHVMLEENLASPPTSCNVGVTRVFPDGSKDTSSFVVPAGKILIITDIKGVIGENITWFAGDVITLRALVIGPSNQEVEILSASGVLSSDSENSEVTAVDSHSQSGALVGPGKAVCLIAFWTRSNGGG